MRLEISGELREAWWALAAARSARVLATRCLEQKIDHPLLDATTKEVIKNFTRVETFGYPFMGWIKATVDASDPRVFTFSPRRWNPPR